MDICKSRGRDVSPKRPNWQRRFAETSELVGTFRRNVPKYQGRLGEPSLPQNRFATRVNAKTTVPGRTNETFLR